MRFTLQDGTPVQIRTIRPSDKDLLADGHSRLSEETVQRRFLAPKPRLTGSELRYLTEVDGHDHFALVAVRAADPADMIAVARLVRLHDDPTTAEAAITVADRKQGKGLGRHLGLMLGDAARERGIERIQATMLSDNPAAHRLMHAIGQRLEDRGHSQGVHEFVANLAA